MDTTPGDLVHFGSSFDLRGQAVTLSATPGPAISLRLGALAVADPWWPEYPEDPVLSIGVGVYPTLLSTITMRRDGQMEPVPLSCAAVLGRVDQVASWQPLVVDEAHFHLDSDSALGAFFDIDDEDVLRPLFVDDQYMQGVYNQALRERIVTMEVEGRTAAVVFLCPDGSGLYPAYAGFDKDMQAVAVLVDLRMLRGVT